MASVFDIWAQKVLGGTKTLSKALTEFGSCESIYNICKSNYELPSCLKKISRDKLFSFTIDQAYDVLKLCELHNWKVISYNDALYPKELLQISDFPVVLFCDGDINLLSSKHKISVVGTRKPSDTGRSVAYKIGLCLSSAGVCLVSGGAFGIDSCSHEGAILGGSGTISVLGCGLGSDYVNKIPFSAERIRKHGLMITEMFPYEKPGRYTFPKRNRIISGISKSCLVVECSEKSGALITADLAKKQNKKIFYINQDILSFGGQKYLSSIGAEPVMNMFDMFLNDSKGLNITRLRTDLHSDGLEGRSFLLEGYQTRAEYSAYHHSGTFLHSENSEINHYYQNTSNLNDDYPKMPEKSLFDNSALGETEKLILSCLSNKPVYPDEISDKTGLDIVSVTVSLTTLEIDGLIKINPGNTVTLN